MMSLQNNLTIRPASTTALYRHPYHSQQQHHQQQQQQQLYYARPPSIQPYHSYFGNQSQSQQQQVVGRGGSSSNRNKQHTPSYNNNNSNNNEPHSHVLELILNSDEPIPTQELTTHHHHHKEQVNVSGYRGVQLNREEEAEWRGGELDRYPINQDPNPEVIRKKVSKPIKYQQKVAVRYLNPPPIRPGDLVIRERQAASLPPAPPLVVRQVSTATNRRTPSPVVLREAPPRPPSVFESKVVRIQNKLPPLPRRVIIENMPSAPQKPAPIIIEKWLPYKPRKVKVIFQRAAPSSTTCCSQTTTQYQQQ